MSSVQDVLDRAFTKYKRKLRGTDQALEKASHGRWGVSALNETSLVWLLSEAVGADRSRLEPVYPNTKSRADLLVKDPEIWIEARWWWRTTETLPSVLGALEKKLAHARTKTEKRALVFTVDDVNTKNEGHKWSEKGAPAWMQLEAGGEWELTHNVCFRSVYVGTATHVDDAPAVKRRKGVFFAGIFERRRGD